MSKDLKVEKVNEAGDDEITFLEEGKNSITSLATPPRFRPRRN